MKRLPQYSRKVVRLLLDLFAFVEYQEGEIRAKIEMIEKLLRAGINWATIESAIEINPVRFAELKQELARLTVPKGADLISSQTTQVG